MPKVQQYLGMLQEWLQLSKESNSRTYREFTAQGYHRIINTPQNDSMVKNDNNKFVK
jgi:hypothetical protein